MPLTVLKVAAVLVAGCNLVRAIEPRGKISHHGWDHSKGHGSGHQEANGQGWGHQNVKSHGSSHQKEKGHGWSQPDTYNHGWGQQDIKGHGWGNHEVKGHGWGHQESQGHGWSYNKVKGHGWGHDTKSHGWGHQESKGHGWGHNEVKDHGWGHDTLKSQGWGPNYKYGYDVNDHHTGDVKSAHEARHEGWTKGSYSLLQPDGVTRTVDYEADPWTGFKATVHHQGWAKHEPRGWEHAKSHEKKNERWAKGH